MKCMLECDKEASSPIRISFVSGGVLNAKAMCANSILMDVKESGYFSRDAFEKLRSVPRLRRSAVKVPFEFGGVASELYWSGMFGAGMGSNRIRGGLRGAPKVRPQCWRAAVMITSPLLGVCWLPTNCGILSVQNKLFGHLVWNQQCFLTFGPVQSAPYVGFWNSVAIFRPSSHPPTMETRYFLARKKTQHPSSSRKRPKQSALGEHLPILNTKRTGF